MSGVFCPGRNDPPPWTPPLVSRTCIHALRSMAKNSRSCNKSSKNCDTRLEKMRNVPAAGRAGTTPCLITVQFIRADLSLFCWHGSCFKAGQQGREAAWTVEGGKTTAAALSELRGGIYACENMQFQQVQRASGNLPGYVLYHRSGLKAEGGCPHAGSHGDFLPRVLPGAGVRQDRVPAIGNGRGPRVWKR